MGYCDLFRYKSLSYQREKCPTRQIRTERRARQTIDRTFANAKENYGGCFICQCSILKNPETMYKTNDCTTQSIRKF